jgi:hypothetical protein
MHRQRVANPETIPASRRQDSVGAIPGRIYMKGISNCCAKFTNADRRIIARASQVFLPPGLLDIGGFANGEGVAPPFLTFFSDFGFFFSLLLRI